LLVSPKCRHLHQGYGDRVKYITYPWSNERRTPRTLSEHLYSPIRLPLSGIDVFNTLMAPLVNPSWSLVVHMKTMHAFTEPASIMPMPRIYRQLNYPRSARLADAIIINSKSLRSEVKRYLEVDDSKLRLIYEAVDHDLFKPGDADLARGQVASYGITKPFVLFVSSLWQYKNCDGLLKAWALARGQLGDRQLAVVGPGRDKKYSASLRALAAELGIADDVVFVGAVPLERTVDFYRAADVFVYPSLNETFGLPILEAMACGCPVVTSDASAMPETAGGAAVLADPREPASIARAIIEAAGPGREKLRDLGLRRAAEFTWGATAASTLDVYREAALNRKRRKSQSLPGLRGSGCWLGGCSVPVFTSVSAAGAARCGSALNSRNAPCMYHHHTSTPTQVPMATPQTASSTPPESAPTRPPTRQRAEAIKAARRLRRAAPRACRPVVAPAEKHRPTIVKICGRISG
jgi:glycosyltransferase involved in cell wall biosynthesis